MYRRRRHLGPELSGGTTNAPEHAELPYHNRLSDEGIGDQGHLVAVLPNFHSDGMPGQPTGLQISRKNGKKEQTTSQDKVRSRQKRTLKRGPDDLPYSTMQVSFLTGMEEGPELKIGCCSFRQFPLSPAALPTLLLFRKPGTRPIAGSTTGRKGHPLNF